MKQRGFWHYCKENKVFYFFVIPGVIWFILFSYLPMIGIIMSFQNYDPVSGFFQSPFVGWENFERLFHTPRFLNALRNTFVISLLKLVITFPLPILFALLMNQILAVRFKKIVQTISYLPYFISWTVAASIWYKLLSMDGGMVNEILMAVGLIEKPIGFLSSTAMFYPIIILTDIWKNIGFSSIIYFSALASVDTQLYEAAKVDGATVVKQMWYISLPGMKPTIVLMFIMAVSNLINADFDQMWNMSNPTVLDLGEILDTYILRSLTTGGLRDLSVGTAAGSFKAVIGLILFLAANEVSKRLAQESLI